MAGSSKSTKDMDAGVPHYVGGLAEACARAPRYGRNGRALVLETARKLAEEEDFVFPKIEGGSETASGGTKIDSASESQEQPKVEKITNFDALFEAIPLGERPLIEYNPRSTKVPRLVRQEAMQTLSGKFLAVILEAIGVAPPKAVDVVSKEGELRKTAMAVALVQEQKIYSKSASKLSYNAEAAKFEAKESDVPVECMEGLLASLTTISDITSGKKRNSEEMNVGEEGETQVSRKARVGSGSLGSDGHDGIPMRDCFGSSSDKAGSDDEPAQNQEETRDKSHLEQDASYVDQACPSMNIGLPWENCERWLSEAEKQLEDATEQDAPWNQYEKCSKKTSKPVQRSDGQRQEPASVHSVFTGNSSRSPGSLNTSKEGKSRYGLEVAGPRDPMDLVQRQLCVFIRAELDPLLQAHVITRNIHGMVEKKTLDKVMSCHMDAVNTDFLIKEGPKIRKLIQQYITYFRSKEL